MTAMDLDLPRSTLAELGEPPFRARQVWDCAARARLDRARRRLVGSARAWRRWRA